jgi:hypothetical protein
VGFIVVVLHPLAVDLGVCLHDGAESFSRVAHPVADLSQLDDVSADLPLVPGHEDCVDVSEVLVQRGSPDAGLLGNVRHPNRSGTVRGGQRPRGVKDRVAHLSAIQCVSQSFAPWGERGAGRGSL